MYPKGGYNVGSSTNAQNLLFSGVKSFWFVWNSDKIHVKELGYVKMPGTSSTHILPNDWFFMAIYHNRIRTKIIKQIHIQKNCRHPKSSSHTDPHLSGVHTDPHVRCDWMSRVAPKMTKLSFFPKRPDAPDSALAPNPPVVVLPDAG